VKGAASQAGFEANRKNCVEILGAELDGSVAAKPFSR
jgi:hypothetical protein